MEMDKSRQPGIRFDGIILAEESFSRIHTIKDDYTPKLEFDVEHNLNEEQKNLLTSLMTKFYLTSEDGEEIYLTLEFKYIAEFGILEDHENMTLKEFEKNAPALIFPYVREHISYMTGKAGFPVNLPPINITALIK